MRHVVLAGPDLFKDFRKAARALIAAAIPPTKVVWRTGADLFERAPADPSGEASATDAPPVSLPTGFRDLAQHVVCHRDPERFAWLYQAIWRIDRGERALLDVATDVLVHRLRRMQQAVRRDCHRMTAFVRFRKITDEGGEHYIAWFEPEHLILRRIAPFFVDRFATMRWSILTPLGSIHWDRQRLTFGPAVNRAEAPDHDALEDWWRRYYRATFNPARVNPAALRAEMPKRYWPNLPEATIMGDLIAGAPARAQAMLATAPCAPRRAWSPRHDSENADAPGDSLAALHAEATGCRRCPLWQPATQLVFGEGPVDAPVVFVGEQPGDHEDLAGRPFVGPAGQVFDRALAQAGIDRSRVYVTNAVKHFKYVPRGKRRLHKTPSNAEVEHCRWWLDREIDVIKPALVVALGATAARALTGRLVTIARERGRPAAFSGGRRGLITVHPSYLLRLPDEAARRDAYKYFVADLSAVTSLVPAVGVATMTASG